MGISPFKSRFDLLLEKAQVQENDFEGNEYTEYGNIMEPKIRDYINSLALDGKKPFIEDQKIVGDIRCHVDGFDGSTVLEIKTTSKIYDDLNSYKVYLVQLLFYMQYMEVENGLLAVYERPKDFNEEFNSERLSIYNVKKQDYLEALQKINEAVNQFRIDLEKVRANPLLTEEDLMPKDLVELSNSVLVLEEQLSKYKKILEVYEIQKEELRQAMKKHNIKKWETPNGYKITLILDGEDKEVQKFNEKKFQEENKELYEKYLETKIQKGRKGSIRITEP